MAHQKTHFDNPQQLLRTLHPPYTKLMQQLNYSIHQLLFRRSKPNQARTTTSPIRPENRLKVLGILTLGFTSIKTPFEVSI